MGTTFANIMARSLETKDTPILSETDVSKKIKERRAEYKEKKLLSAQQKALKDRGHCIPDITQKSFETQLRKVATQGVVRLFNAVKDFQQRGADEVDSKQVSKLPIKQRGKRLVEASKEKFDQILQQERRPKSRRTAKAGASPGAPGPNQIDEFG